MLLNKKIFLLISIFTFISIIFSQSVFAARIGGGKNYGSKRSFSKTNLNQQYHSNPVNMYQNRNANTNTQSQQNINMNNNRNNNVGMGVGKAIFIGAAVGAAGGYLAGKLESNSNTNNKEYSNMNAATENTAHSEETINNTPQAFLKNNLQETKSINTLTSQNNIDNIPWGIIGILGVLLFIGLIFFKRKTISSNNSPYDPFNNNSQLESQQENTLSNNSFNIPSIKRTDNTTLIDSMQTLKGQNQSQLNNKQNNSIFQHEKMADGVEIVYFIRQIKGMFLHIQSMNNVENIREIAKYMTPEFYNEIKDEIINNNTLADFSELNCELLNSETIGDTLVASVKFSGMVSEDLNQQMKPFSEIWHFVKTDLPFGRWLVSGIEQVSV